METLAFAKLNLTLEVLGRRDDGYHEVRTILQTIDLADRIEVVPGPALQVECDDPSLNGQANLVWRAAESLAKYGSVQPGAHIRIQKHIPVGMGLGGGSSDAAAALVALNQLWDLGMTTGDLAQVAAGLGSDVPFFLWGGTALSQGRGEQISPLPTLPSVPVTLVCPRTTLPNKTATLYSSLTPAHFSDGGVTRRIVEILAGGQFVVESIAGLLQNIFEEVAPHIFLDLGWLQRKLNDLTPSQFHLTGAGPALFGMPSSDSEHQMLAEALDPYDVEVYLVHTTTPHATIGSRN
uniref:Putative GHMP kinases putative ATP-binding protein n=1 Tax=uncultured marine microorganism HF4000_010I05 TaxID=455517 RepID=B3T1I0_9ZZZZ|nr:putative GHMP kinases putative ATP-binding protein [uncultured marine microorganism HF4000_010I05]